MARIPDSKPSSRPMPLSGIKVLDLSRVLAGPYAGQLLADFGADVIKVEDLGGDELRSWFPRTKDDQSSNFQSVNRGKRSITLNLKTEEGQALLGRLVTTSDVLIQSFLPPVAARLGADYDTLAGFNPKLVYCAISGYGASGDLKDKPGYDLMMQAYSGMMMLTGEPQSGPMRAGISAIDLSTGMLAFGGILTALLSRDRHGAAAQRVDVSLLESSVALLSYHVTNYMNAGFLGERAGSGVGHIVPYQAFPTSDGYVLAGAPNDNLWRRMANAVQLDELADDSRFMTTVERRKNRESLIEILSARFATDTTRHWVTVLEATGVPVSPVRTIDEVVYDPQVLARDMILSSDAGVGEAAHFVGTPLKLSGLPPTRVVHPPALGEHTDEILRGAGVGPQVLAQFRKDRII
jgi:crotonobetainyl-CoA:carnitine CoA-transferase CaiB-like acyl-CoA transferase